MPRSKINSASKDLIKDNGSVLVSVVEGEQIRIEITLNWITNLSSHTLTAKVVEADMAGAKNSDGYPLDIKSGGVVTTLTILDSVTTDNKFSIVIPQTLSESWTTQPTPDKPSYGWIGLEVADDGVGNNQQVWKPFRGLVEVLFSPSEEA